MRPGLPVPLVLAALVAGILWAGMAARQHLAGGASLIDRFESVVQDVRIAVTGRRAPPPQIAIVAIDDATLDALGAYPLQRSRLADLVTRIREAGARALAVDILLNGSTRRGADIALAEALHSLPAVIASAARLSDTPAANAVPRAQTLLAPAERFMAVAGSGPANISADAGGTPRHAPMLVLTEDGLVPSFALASAGRFAGTAANVTGEGLDLTGKHIPLDLGWHLALNYYGPSGTIPTTSALALLESGAGKAPELTDRLVVLGVTATAVGDRFSTPFDPVLPGVEVQATAIANLIEAMPLARTIGVRTVDAAAAVILTLAGLLAVAFLPLAPACLAYAVILAAWLGLGTLLYADGIWLSGALPLAASLPPVAALILARQVADRMQSRRHQRARDALGRFQSPRLARRIADDPEFLAAPREQVAPILFIDLAGYTGLSERLGAARTRAFLKEFHTLVVEVSETFDGIVLDFMGDGAMIGFGLPAPRDDDPARALACAFRLEETVSAWLRRSAAGTGEATGREWGGERSGERSGGPEECSWGNSAGDGSGDTGVRAVRVGAHIGPVVLSRLGHDSQQQIAATGDCVNVASRLLETGKAHGAAVVVSTDLRSAAAGSGATPPTPPRRETVTLRGRRQPLEVGLWPSCSETDSTPASTPENAPESASENSRVPPA